MNSYYSNLIEGHDTHPMDIERALKNDYSTDIKKRNLQREAKAHISLSKSIRDEIVKYRDGINPYSSEFLRGLHKRFYELLPKDFLEVKTREGSAISVVPGEFRTREVEVGSHVAPHHDSLQLFMDRFSEYYNPSNPANKSKARRIVGTAAAHHRFVWMHPFLDGNGRVVRLMSDAFFAREGLDSSGLCTISGGLGRNVREYMGMLANANMKRMGDYDDRGDLSNRMLIVFCQFFLKTAIDQVEYMTTVLDVSSMLERISAFCDLLVLRKRIKPEARYILMDVFLKG